MLDLAGMVADYPGSEKLRGFRWIRTHWQKSLRNPLVNLMKNRNSILTHAAVFVAGIALAMVGYRANPSQTQGDADAQAARSSSARHSGEAGGSGTDARSTALRERREAAARAGRTSEPATERLANIIRIGDPLERQAALMELLNRLGPDEFAAVAEQYRNSDHYGRSSGEYDLILRSWAKADPLGALEYTAAQPHGESATATVLAAWAGRDAAAAEAWAVAHHTGDGPNPYLVAVIRGLAAFDIAGATRLAATLPPSGEQRDAVDSITRALFMQGLDAAMNFPSSIEDPKLRARFVAAVADRLADKDPAQAGTWLAAMKDPDDQNRAARRVGEAMASQDPQVAAAWVAKLSPAARAEAARGIIPKMSAGDITGTAQWVASLSGIPGYDRVVEEYVWSCDYRAPEQSAAWIRGVADVEQQTKLYHSMLGEWAKRDAAAVKTWVASNQVPASVARRFNH